MKNLINKIGLDKIAHFGIGAFICAAITFIAIIQDIHCLGYKQILLYPIIGYVLVLFLSFFKEYFIDTPNFCWKDILAGMLGCVAIHIAICIGVLLNYLSVC